MIENINIAEDAELGFDPDCDCYRCERLRMDAIWDDTPEPEFFAEYPEDGYLDASYEDYYADASMAYWD